MGSSWSTVSVAVAVMIGTAGWGYRRFGTALNPPTLHSLAFLAQLAVYGVMSLFMIGLDLHFDLMHNLPRVAAVYAVACACFATPWITWSGREYLRVDSDNEKTVDVRCVSVVSTCALIALFTVIIFAIAIIGFPLAQMLRGQLDVAEMQESLKRLPPGVLAANLWLGYLLALYVSAGLTYRRTYHFSRLRLGLMIFGVVIAGVWQAKRQIILIMLVFIALFFAADRARRKQRAKLFVTFGLTFAAFAALYVAVQLVRVGGTALFLSEGPLSAMWPMLNLDRIMDLTAGSGHLVTLFSELLPNRWFGHGYGDFIDVLFEPTAPNSYVLFGYYDFGFLGVAFAGLLFGLETLAFSALFPRSVTGMQIRVLVLWVCLAAPVYPHAFSLNFFLMPVVLLFLARAALGGHRYSREFNSRAKAFASDQPSALATP